MQNFITKTKSLFFNRPTQFATIVFIVLFGWLAATPVTAATFVVNSTTDAVDAIPGDGFCATSTGVCTLRAAIQEANHYAGEDTVSVPSGTYALAILGNKPERHRHR